MKTFERYLTLWVAMCIVVGIAIGQYLPGIAWSSSLYGDGFCLELSNE